MELDIPHAKAHLSMDLRFQSGDTESVLDKPGTHGERSVNIVDRSLIRVRQKEFHCVMAINGILSGADAS